MIVLFWFGQVHVRGYDDVVVSDFCFVFLITCLHQWIDIYYQDKESKTSSLRQLLQLSFSFEKAHMIIHVYKVLMI